MTFRQALTHARARLLQAGSSPRQAEAEARQLIGWLAVEGVDLWRRIDAEMAGEQQQKLEDALKRRISGEPLQLIIGSVEFFGLRLAVRPGVLIPRPETELLVELALGLVEGATALRVLDVGTGSGAIALAIKRQRPGAVVYASDVSPAALELARENAAAHGLDVTLLHASLTAGLSDLDLIVSNPPYLPASDEASAPIELSREANEALYAGEDGLAVARPLIDAAGTALKPGGWLALELDPRNVETAAEYAADRGFTDLAIHPDLSGAPRFLSGRRG